MEIPYESIKALRTLYKINTDWLEDDRRTGAIEYHDSETEMAKAILQIMSTKLQSNQDLLNKPVLSDEDKENIKQMYESFKKLK